MPVLTLTSHVTSASGLADGMITDLEIANLGGSAGPTLYATTGYSGRVSAWDLTASGPSQINNSRNTQGDVVGTEACLAFIQTAQGMAVLTGGGASDDLVLRLLSPTTGGLSTQTILGTLPNLPGNLIATLTVTLASGAQIVYGGLAGAAGVGQVSFSASGSLTGSSVTSDTAATAADQVVALAEAQIGGQQYLFTASAVDVGITSWAVSATGALTAVATIGIDDGLWIGTPTAMEVAVVAGQTYLVLSAAGSNTLTLVAVGTNGTLQVTDHVMDDLSSRFSGATALEVVEHGGQTYVIVGGADDGVSLYQVLPGGQLLALAHLADTAAMGLSDVSALAAQSTSTGIQIFVGSSSETGLTQLNFDPGPAGQTLVAGSAGGALVGTGNNDVLKGNAGGDVLSGGAGADILLDDAGADTLTGGTGADIFVMAADGTADTITDFTPGSDRIDLSGWALLRGPSQLQMVSTATGMTLSYGSEVLVIHSSSGGPINPATLTEADLLNLTRIPVAAPFIPAPPLVLSGTVWIDALNGESGPDQILGGAGNDTLFGADGSDSLYGGLGEDRLDGGSGADVMNGGPGNDTFVVESTGDWVQEEIPIANGGGIDTVQSWIDHFLTDNVELLVLQGDADINGTGRATFSDGLAGNAGNNVLNGLGGNDALIGWSGHDTLIGGTGKDRLIGGAGADMFLFNSLDESGAGRAARDRIEGFDHGADQINLYPVDANTLVSGDQSFRFIGSAGFSAAGATSAGEMRGTTSATGGYVLLEMDTNGDGTADMQIMVVGTSEMTVDDFIL